MSQLVIDKSILRLESIDQVSNSPTDTYTSESGIVVYTYTNDAQRYEFKLRGMTRTHEQYAQLNARMEQLHGADTFILDLGSWGGDVFPQFNTITNNLYVEGAVASGISVIPYTNDTTAPSGVAPNGLLGVGSFLKFKDATYDKMYRVIAVDSSAHTYTIFPSLREAITDETQIEYGSAVKARVRLNRDTWSFSQSVDSPKGRKYSFTVTEDYTSTT